MAKQLVCDFCLKPVSTIVAKYYRAPILPGKSQVSFMSNYSHWAEACVKCDEQLLVKLTKRKARNGSEGKNTTTTSKVKKKDLE